MMSVSRRSLIVGTLAASAAALAGCAPKQVSYNPSGEGIVDVVVPYSSGGGTDTWARFITPYFAQHFDGVDRYQIQNIPGGESITGTNAYVDAGITSGQQLMVASATTYFQSMLGHRTARFNFAEMEPLALNGTGAVVWTNVESGIRSVDDLMNFNKPVKYAGMSPSGLDLVALLALEVLGVNVKGVFGFEGRGPTRLSVQRNETHLDFQTTATYLTQVQPLVNQGKAVPLFSVGVLDGDEIIRDPNLPEVPTLSEVMGDRVESTAYEAYRSFVTPGFFYQKGLWANKGTDPTVIEKYYSMVDTLNQSDQFLSEAKDALGGYNLVSGTETRDQFRRAIDLPEEVLAFTQDFLLNKHSASLH